jgi:hypothetical protein
MSAGFFMGPSPENWGGNFFEYEPLVEILSSTNHRQHIHTPALRIPPGANS